MEAEALYDFDSTDEEELRFSKGSILKILNTEDTNWYFAEIKGHEGFVPVNYIKYEKPSWYIDKIDGPTVFEQLLRYQTGTFICRPSRSFPGEFALSVVNSELKLTHFRIFKNSGYYNIWKEKFSSLNQLVTYYKRQALIKCDIPLILVRAMDSSNSEPTSGQSSSLSSNTSRNQTTDDNEDDDEVFEQ